MKKIVKVLETEGEQSDCELLCYNFRPRNKSNKQKNKQSNLLTLIVSCEKRSCLIRRK